MPRNTNALERPQLDVTGAEALAKDPETVNKDGQPLFKLIDGVVLRPAVTQADERGTVCEMFDLRWKFDDEPLVYVYQASILPRQVKGWVVHFEQNDRLFFSVGRMRLVLFDGRRSSPTYEQLNRFEVGELNRCLLSIPAGVYHAVENIGEREAYFYNMPTKPYRHENPDKFRLPLENGIIPYRFNNVRGG
jgi:dTDP-4-dehydrorhamnose 3,5-epimerase